MIKDIEEKFDKKFVDEISLEINNPIFKNRYLVDDIKAFYRRQIKELLDRINKELPKIVIKTTGLPPDKLSLSQVFYAGQANMGVRVEEIIKKYKNEI